MSSEHCAIGKIAENFFGGRNVGGQHELLDHRVGLENLFNVDVDGIGRLAIHAEPVKQKHDASKDLNNISLNSWCEIHQALRSQYNGDLNTKHVRNFVIFF